MSIGLNGSIPKPPAYYQIIRDGVPLRRRYDTWGEAASVMHAMNRRDQYVAAYNASGKRVNMGIS